MKIDLRQRGGFGGTESRVELDDGEVRIVSGDGIERLFRLDDTRWALVKSLASRVVDHSDGFAPERSNDPPPSDAMELTLAIAERGRHRDIHVVSGDQASAEVWELLSQLLDLGADDR